MVKSNPIPFFENHERILSKIRVCAETRCWIFTGGISKTGYGVFDIKDKSYSAHRVSFSIFKNLQSGDLVIDHICRNKKCINPDHLREVSRKINTRENNSSPATLNHYKTHCSKGHLLEGDNLYIYKSMRGCKICRRFNWSKNNTGVGKGGYNKAKTHCRNGHEFTSNNTYIKKKGNGKFSRTCRTCSLISCKKTRKNKNV